MKKIRSIILTVVMAGLMLVPFLVQASGNLIISTDVFTGSCKVTAFFENSANMQASIELISSNVNKEELNVSSDALIEALSKVTFFDQLKCDSKGSVTFEFPVKSSGEYVVLVQSMTNMDDVLEEEIDFVTFSDANIVWNNLVSDPEENLAKLIKILNVKDEFVLSMVSNDMLLSEIKGYGSIGNFTKENADILIAKIKTDCESIAFLIEVLDDVKNAENTTEINKIVSVAKKADALGITEYMSRYNSLYNTKIADNAVVGKTYTTASDFVADFVAGIEAAEKAQNENPPSDKPAKPQTGGSVGGGSLGVSVITPDISQNTHSFTDISNVSWANEAIIYLYNEGIINGKSKTEFAPNDNITREEFVKIALGVMGVDPVATPVTFADVDASSWYAPYVSTALSAGIVSGYSDTQFGVGENITRQDVAVILNRVYSVTSSNKSVAFSDTSDISDYAKSAVEKLSSAGIINGSDGKFMPKSPCTRAEAACMVYRIMSLMKEGK